MKGRVIIYALGGLFLAAVAHADRPAVLPSLDFNIPLSGEAKVLCVGPEDCRQKEVPFCDGSPDTCIVSFQLEIPLADRLKGTMTEYVHSEIPTESTCQGAGGCFLVDCTRTFDFPWGSVTARFGTIFCPVGIDPSGGVDAVVCSPGDVTGGTTFFNHVEGTIYLEGRRQINSSRNSRIV